MYRKTRKTLKNYYMVQDHGGNTFHLILLLLLLFNQSIYQTSYNLYVAEFVVLIKNCATDHL